MSDKTVLIEPRCLNLEQAASYIGLSGNNFAQHVAAGKLPKPIRFGTRKVWDRRALDATLDVLSGLGGTMQGETSAPPDKDPFLAGIESYAGQTKGR